MAEEHWHSWTIPIFLEAQSSTSEDIIMPLKSLFYEHTREKHLSIKMQLSFNSGKTLISVLDPHPWSAELTCDLPVDVAREFVSLPLNNESLSEAGCFDVMAPLCFPASVHVN